MPRDLTGILMPAGKKSADEIRALVEERMSGALWLRVAPLESIGVTQVEVVDGRRGFPGEDPELVARLSSRGRAVFVHVNHSAKQAMLHAFADGDPIGPGWAGTPGADFDARLREAIGHTIDEITAADDGTRRGIGLSSSHTTALVRGRKLKVPLHTPTGLDSFVFHDRTARPGGERMALFAYDAASLAARLATPARELAAHIQTAPPGTFGPLEGARGETVEMLAKLGDATVAAPLVRAVELCALECALVWGGGERVAYLDQRVLPMLSLSSSEPVFDKEELEALEETASLLSAMVEVLPWSAPPSGEGALLAGIADEEVAPLAPWAEPGEEYAGAIFKLQPARLLELRRAFDAEAFTARMQKFEHAWYRAARPGKPEGDAFDAWHRALAEQGHNDIGCFFEDWAELRIVLELAELNRLEVAMLFYEGS